MTSYLSYVAIAIIALAFSSCKKDLVENPNLAEYTSDVEQFEAVWNGLNTSYILWPIDTTDWDDVYSKYHPIFLEMENEPDEVWKMTWKELASTLIDHHLEIHLERPSTKTKISINPGLDEIMSRAYFHFPKNTIDKLGMILKLELNGRLKDVKTYHEGNLLICSGVLDEDIAYIYFSNFKDIIIDEVEPFQHFKQYVASQDIKTAIIDLRGNPGGKALNPNYLTSCFSSRTLTVGCNQTKTGLGRYDLGPKVPYKIGAGVTIDDVMLEGQDRDIPVIVVCDLFSGSAAEIATIAIKQLPHSYMVGERTWGATCVLNNDFGLFYSGSFGDSQMNDNNWIGHGHYVYTPKYLFSGIDGTIYEGIGITPDKECLFDQQAWNNGIDNQLETAISFAKSKITEN